MGDDDFISALNQAVKQDIIEHYLRERRIVEEETHMLFEACSAFLGGVDLWEERKAALAQALLTQEGVDRFFSLAGLSLTADVLRQRARVYPKVRGFSRARRYRRLITRLYTELWQTGRGLAQERQEVLELRQEVNQDIQDFERNYDLMGLQCYLRAMDPVELQRRKLLGVNFTAREMAESAAALSFHPLSAQRLGLDVELDHPRPPEDLLPAAQGLLDELCRRHPLLVDNLWSAPA